VRGFPFIFLPQTDSKHQMPPQTSYSNDSKNDLTYQNSRPFLVLHRYGYYPAIGSVSNAHSLSSQLAPVWLTTDAPGILRNLYPQNSLWEQLRPAIALLHTPVAHDTSAEGYARRLEQMLGGPEGMSTRVGVCGHSSLLAAQIMHIRDAKPDVWSKAGRVQLASSFLASILTGVVAPMAESDASGTGLYSLAKEQWDDAILQAVGGETTQDLLGPVERASSKPVGTLSPYFSQKYGLEPSTCLSFHPFAPPFPFFC
jgi:xylulokinase